MDDGAAVDIVCFEFSTAFGIVSQSILIGKLGNVGWMSGQRGGLRTG